MSGSTFLAALEEAQGGRVRHEDRSWAYVPYDQLSDQLGLLGRRLPSKAGIVLIESSAKAGRRPYHKQKLALVLTNQRHFAIEQAKRGVAVDYRFTDEGYAHVLRNAVETHGPLEVMRPAERELRTELAPLFREGLLIEQPHEGWLTSRETFLGACGDDPPWRMEAFYRVVRRRTGYLMEDGKPLDGRYSLDADNRRPWTGEPAAPERPTFRQDDITREVIEIVEERYGDHPGRIDASFLPASSNQVKRLWTWALESCLPHFGPYEDAMSRASTGIFHTRISPLLNLHRLLPRAVIEDALAADIPLQSKEGFLRQVIGWREFVRHVHELTDGFRHGDEEQPSFLDAHAALPAAYWGTPSGLACLDQVVEDVWREGYSHHITRLMILGNIATLLSVEPRELSDWFWVAYADAYDWVVEPNVLAMATFGTGPLMTTKPYVSGAAYIARMSDYCDGCSFHPKKTCPITPLYWNFLAEQRERLADNPRLNMPLASLRKRSEAKQQHDRAVARWVRETLASGDVLEPDQGPSA